MQGRALALRAAGVERFDAGEVHAIEALLARAASSRDGVRRRLEERARQHLFTLELRFRSAQVQALGAIDVVARRDAAAAKALRERADGGDVDGARREAERLLARGSSRRTAPAIARVKSALDIVERRCSTLPPVVREARELLEGRQSGEGDLAARAHDLANLLNLVLLRDGAEQLGSMLEVDRMERGAPIAPGPYNPDALAARVVGELSSLSPAFARAWLSWVKDIEALSRLPATADEKPAKVGKAARASSRGARKKP